MPLKCRETADKVPISEQEKLIFQYAIKNGGIIAAQVTELLGIKQRKAREIFVKMYKKVVEMGRCFLKHCLCD